MLDDNQVLLLFLGSGRTGSILLEQLINHHLECLIDSSISLMKSHQIRSFQLTVKDIVSKTATGDSLVKSPKAIPCIYFMRIFS